MGYAEAIAAIIQLAGGMKAEGDAAIDKASVMRIMQRAMEEYGKIDLPTLKELVPQEIERSSLEDVEQDPRLKEEQLAGLDALKEMSDSGGLMLEDKAALNDINSQVARKESAGRGAIANDFAARGQLGSGAQLAMSLSNEQDAANRAAQAGQNTAASAQKRYFDSILQRGKMAGDMDDRDYQRKANAARARDLINQHNAAARTDAAKYNNTLGQQQLGNKLSLAQARTTGDYKTADYLSGEARRRQAATAGQADALAQGISAFGDDDEEDK